MNLLQLVLKQMRQRALSTWLTLMSVMLGVGLATTIMIVQREGARLFAQTEYGFDVLVGPSKGSSVQIALNSIYHIDKSPGNLNYSVYEELTNPDPKMRRMVRWAVPIAVGDSYKGQRLVGTTPQMFGMADDGVTPLESGKFEYRPGRTYELAAGRVFGARKFQAVIGADVTRLTGLKIGETFHVTHGMPAANEKPDVHDEVWKVVGVMKRTGTAVDRVIFIPLISLYTIAEHEEGMEAIDALNKGADQAKLAGGQANAKAHHHHHHGEDGTEFDGPFTLDANGDIQLEVDRSLWLISAVFVKARGEGPMAEALLYNINNRNLGQAMNPARVMREFFNIFLEPGARLLLMIAVIVQVVAGVGILVAIYNAVSSRLREIAILRALGATRGKILSIICAEAGLVGLLGALAGLVLGHVGALVASVLFLAQLGGDVSWATVSPPEVIYCAGVVVLSVLAGLVPAMKAYQTPVATNLSAG